MKRIIIAASLTIAMPCVAADVAKAGRAAVAEALKDPESAKFRSAYVNGKNYCGEVNAKNSYGGYVGFRRFVVSDSEVTFDNSTPDMGLFAREAFETVWREACWTKEKLKAYNQEKAERLAEIERDIERKREEVRRQEEESERIKAAAPN